MAELTVLRRGLVLGGGGVAGIAWQLGLVAGLARAGVMLREADAFVGTSAGAVVAAQLASTAALAHLLADQLDPPADSAEQLRPYSQTEADAANRKLYDKVHGDLRAARQRIGAFALRASTPTLAERRHIIASRLPMNDWPAARLQVVAVAADSGDRRVLDAASGVDFIDAISASCAVPGSWPAVPIAGTAFVDGGVYSITNADIAQDVDRVLVLSPFGYSEGNPVSGHLAEEVRQLQDRGVAVMVIAPDDASMAALGPNVLDPSRRPFAARAGLAQGHLLQETVRAFW